MGVAAVGETPSLAGQSIGGAHRVLERTQAQPPRTQLQGSTSKGIIHLRVVGEVTESGARAEQVALFPL